MASAGCPSVSGAGDASLSASSRVTRSNWEQHTCAASKPATPAPKTTACSCGSIAAPESAPGSTLRGLGIAMSCAGLGAAPQTSQRALALSDCVCGTSASRFGQGSVGQRFRRDRQRIGDVLISAVGFICIPEVQPTRPPCGSSEETACRTQPAHQRPRQTESKCGGGGTLVRHQNQVVT
jgi:hypothetical protein